MLIGGRVVPEQEIRETLAEILSRTEYQGSTASWFELWNRIVWDWLNKFFFFNEVVEPTVGQRNFASALILILFVILCILAIYAISRIRKVIIARRRGLQDDIGLTPDEWSTRYSTAVAAGDFNEAFRCAWRHTLAWLNEHERVVERKGLTTGEAVTEAGLSDPAFASFTQRFDQALYARRPAGEQDVAQAAEWRDAIFREVKGR